MSIIRRAERLDRNFTILDNDVIEDRELSFRALGVLVYILRQPDNWETNADRLAQTHQEGRDAIRAALEQLEDAGYVIRSRVRVAGRYATETVVYDRPHDREIGGKSHQSGKPALVDRSGFPGVSTSTTTKNETKDEENDRRSASGRGSRKPKLVREPDDPTGSSDDESPALGADPQPKRTAATRREKALKSSTPTPFGLALKLDRELRAAGYAAPVNERAVTRQMKDWGLGIDVLQEMVRIFCAAPSRYLKGDEVPWIGFVRQREALRADAEKVLAVSAPASDYAEGL